MQDLTGLCRSRSCLLKLSCATGVVQAFRRVFHAVGWDAVAAPADLCAKLTTNMSDKQWHDWIAADIGYEEVCQGLPRAPD